MIQGLSLGGPKLKEVEIVSSSCLRRAEGAHSLRLKERLGEQTTQTRPKHPHRMWILQKIAGLQDLVCFDSPALFGASDSYIISYTMYTKSSLVTVLIQWLSGWSCHDKSAHKLKKQRRVSRRLTKPCQGSQGEAEARAIRQQINKACI